MSDMPTDQPLYVAKAQLFRSLGHPVRIRILELLVLHEMPVSVLRDEIGVEASSLSQHLNVLKQSGLVVSHRRANAVTYSITDDAVGEFLSSARRVLASTMGRTRSALEHLEAQR
ncbi:MAG: metalloregulator ArsR/SmtB family transcription factor [Actinomycetota bacterium]|nr:metalloregulator ArsR/SmtB family transcription factor [Actinomycetota bacterium]